jgi:hypothetical protein
MVFGLTDVSTGAGFSTIKALLPVFVVSAALVAVTVIVFGLGKFTGAVYNPVESIVPVVAFPPATAFTDHVTLAFAFPATAAANACVAPARTDAEAGVTVTSTPAFSGGVVGDVGEVLLVVPTQPPTSNATIPVDAIQVRFTDMSPIINSGLLLAGRRYHCRPHLDG